MITRPPEDKFREFIRKEFELGASTCKSRALAFEPCPWGHVHFSDTFLKANLQLQSILTSSEYGKLKNNKCHSELNYLKAALSQLWNGSLSHKLRQNESSHSPTLPEPRNGPYQTSISHTCWSAAKADITSASVNPRCVKDASLFFDDLLFCTGLITA